MTNVTVPVDAKLFDYVERAVKSGKYASKADLMRVALLKLRDEDAFAALRIKHYRNFLRMKFEPDQMTIYPIGVDKVPRFSGWTSHPADGPVPEGRSTLVPREPLVPHLIEEPIIIRPEYVKS